MKKCYQLLLGVLASGLLSLSAFGQTLPQIQDCSQKTSIAKSACEKQNASVEYCKNSNQDARRCMNERAQLPAPLNCDTETVPVLKTWCEKARTTYFACFKKGTNMDYYRCMSQFEAANPRPQIGIKVNYARYGMNCEARNPDVTGHVARTCNQKASCSYTVDHNVIGDPAYGCHKDYQVSYTCPGQSQSKIASLPPEASGKTVLLACP